MRKQILVLAGFSCFFWMVLPLLAANGPVDSEKKRQDTLRAVRAEKIATFRAIYPNVAVHINKATGIPAVLDGDLSTGLTKSDPVGMAYEFFEKNKEVFGMAQPQSELKVKGESKDQYGGTVGFKQVYKGVDVWNGVMYAHFTPSGRLKYVNGEFYPDITLSATPSIDSAAAIEIAKRDINLPADYLVWAKKYLDAIGNPCQPISVSLSISRFSGKYHLVWVVGINVDYGVGLGAWNYFIDAHSGAILKKASLSMQEPIELPSRGFQKDTLSAPRQHPKDSTQQSLPQDPPEEKKESVLPPDITRPPKEFPKPSDTSKTPFVAGPEKPQSFQLKKQKEPASDTLQRGKIVPVRFRLSKPIDSLIKWQNRKGQNREQGKKQNLEKDPRVKEAPHSTVPAVFQTIMSEDFEGDFPAEGSNWYVLDAYPADNLEYFWDDDNYKAALGDWSAWCANGGADGLDPQFNLYPPNMDSRMFYGPFSLSDADNAYLTFDFWCRSEENWDSLVWLASDNGQDFGGFAFTGNSIGWRSEIVDLNNVPFMDSLTGKSGLWIAFGFKSDESVQDTGAFLDNIQLVKDAPLGDKQLRCGQWTGWSGPIIVSSVRGTHTQSQPVVGDTAFIDWGVANFGEAPTSIAFVSTLYINGDSVQSWRVDPPLAYLNVDSVLDFPYVFTATGVDTLRIVHDVYNTIAESNEGDNWCELVVSVGCNPGDYIGTGVGVLGINDPQGPKTHIDAQCNGTIFVLRDSTRQLNNDPHNHDGSMKDFALIPTYRWNSSLGHAELMSDADNVWNADGQASGIDAHVYAGWTYDYLLRPLGRNGFDSLGERLMISTVEFPIPGGAGADYVPSTKEVRYKPPVGGYKSYAGAIDIVAHEWGHGVTDFSSRLAYEREPGALNESFSDMLGVSVGFATSDPDWQRGEHVTPAGNPLSDLYNPLNSWPNAQPNTYRGTNWVKVNPIDCPNPSEPNDWCGIHRNRGVPNKMFYLFANFGTDTLNGVTVNGIGINNAMRVMLRANERPYWNPNTDFLQARIGTISAANDLNPSWVSELKKAWDAVRVCDRGDVNSDGQLSPADVVLELTCVFNGADCNSCSSDLNCTEDFSPADITLILFRVFSARGDGCPPP
ncbi:MAG TPA: M4 family metallopeptidase [Verrucomicrobiae bacterium]|nr:M4 family metallopeptidase [Verrucomicrobiae bacterium]